MGSAREFGARPANGTEGDIMRAQLCDRCTVDHDWHRYLDEPTEEGQPESCPIIMSAMVGEYAYPAEGPPQWSYDDAGNWGCTEFDGPCECDS